MASSIDYSARSVNGLVLSGECVLMGAVEAPQKKNPEKKWHRVHLAPDEESRAEWVFCDEAWFGKAAGMLADAGGPVAVTATVLVTSHGLNLDSLA